MAAQPSADIDVFGLTEDQPRYVKFVHGQRRLAAVVRLTVDDFDGDKPKDISVQYAATITGRVVDRQDGCASIACVRGRQFGQVPCQS